LNNVLYITVPQAPALKSCFVRTLNLKENKSNFGTAIYLKSRAERLGTNRYEQYA